MGKNKKIKQNFEPYYFTTDSKEDFYLSCILRDDLVYVTIGDVHGCITELVNLLIKNDFTIDRDGVIEDILDKRKIILLGDYIDKGTKEGIKKTVNFIYLNRAKFELILGNHENFVYKYLKGILKKDVIPQEIRHKYFDSTEYFKDDEDFKSKLFQLCRESKPFFIHKNFIITHAPCRKEYLGKLDSKSLRNQRTKVTEKRRDFEDDISYFKYLAKEFSFLHEEGDLADPYHIFGHIQFDRVQRIKNKIGIDTGCVAGGYLTSVEVQEHELKFKSIKSLYPETESLINL